jgi:hypothetical protein
VSPLSSDDADINRGVWRLQRRIEELRRLPATFTSYTSTANLRSALDHLEQKVRITAAEIFGVDSPEAREMSTFSIVPDRNSWIVPSEQQIKDGVESAIAEIRDLLNLLYLGMAEPAPGGRRA